MKASANLCVQQKRHMWFTKAHNVTFRWTYWSTFVLYIQYLAASQTLWLSEIQNGSFKRRYRKRI